MVRRSLLVVLFCAALAGCLRTPAVPASPPVTSPSAPATSPAPSTSAPGTSAPSTSATTPATTSPAATPPARPPIDVSKYASADFASPSGRIWCGLHADVALCHFPNNYQGRIPDSEEICPEVGLDVTGVEVTRTGSRYFCSGDPSAWPVKGSKQVRWHAATGFGFVRFDGNNLARLPYGRTLRHGEVQCLSETNGVTCTNTATGHGFRMARAGVALF